jgi:NAD(P)H-binding
MRSPLFLITGATGNTGREAVELLLERGHHVRAFVHQEGEYTARLQQRGAEIVVGDLLDFSTVRPALEGVSGAYFVYPTAPGLIEATAYFAQAAKEAAVSAVVNMSQISARREAKSHAAFNHWVGERLSWSGPFVPYASALGCQPFVYMMLRHARGYDEVNVAILEQVRSLAIGLFGAEGCGGSVGCLLAAGSHGREFYSRQLLNRRDMRLSRPPTIGASADDPHPQQLHHRTLLLRSSCRASFTLSCMRACLTLSRDVRGLFALVMPRLRLSQVEPATALRGLQQYSGLVPQGVDQAQPSTASRLKYPSLRTR